MRKAVGFILLQAVAALLLPVAVGFCLYGAQAQVWLWASACDVWKPSVWPLLASLYYWVLPVASSLLFFLDTGLRAIEGLKSRTGWFWFNAALWMPLWFIPVGTVLLLACAVAAWVGSIKVAAGPE